MLKTDLIAKYNVPAPRYTSYPTVPFWNEQLIDDKTWMQITKRTFDESNHEKGISIYIHLPFCESLCTYCGCNTRITKNHKVEEGYITSVLQEWQLYLTEWVDKPLIRELHLGGGTPTFFSAENLEILLKGILKDAKIHPEYEFSFEGHPNNTTERHLKVLYDYGFRRVSYGIQDLDLKVQIAIHRIQPFKNVKVATDLARQIGYNSVNFDLIYGLPFQTPDSIAHTIDKVGQLMPERIAFYSYAHVPWLKPGQRGYSEKDLPDNEDKRILYELGREKLLALGYKDVGIDHFSLASDSLYKATEKGTLHRNFMGYTVCKTDLLIGLGTSAISDAKYGYMQNEKVVEKYKERISNNALAVFKSHEMAEEDLTIKKYILQLLCQGQFEFDDVFVNLLSMEAKTEFITMVKEELITISKRKLVVTELGKVFIRNIAMVMDLKLRETTRPSVNIFSKAI
jgi:oxygen-independent coproporphyrinogen-3 oxidase